MRRVLVTGSGGFVGWHVCRLLRARGHEVIGVVRRPDPGDPAGTIAVDLADAEATARVLADLDPELVIHLAGTRRGDLPALLAANVLTAQVILDASRSWRRAARVLLVGSAAQYGAPASGDLPFDEGQPQRPFGPYGLTKSWVEQLGWLQWRAHGLPVIVARLFNVCGPREPSGTFVGSVVARLAAAEPGVPTHICTRSLHTRRDLIDVRDAAGALVLLAERGRSGEAYNVCSGRGVEMREVLERAIQLSGCAATYEEQAGPPASDGVEASWGDPSKLRRELGWTATIPLDQTLHDALDAAKRARLPVQA